MSQDEKNHPQDRLVTAIDLADITAVLADARRCTRIASTLLLAAEGPHDSPFNEMRNDLNELEDRLTKHQAYLEELEPYVSQF